MKNKFNTLHKFVFEYSTSECTKETVNGLFRSVIEPIISEPKAEACILLKISDRTGIDSLLKRLSFSGREIFSFNDNLSDLNIQNVSTDNIWDNTDFLVISAKRYSAALIWDYSVSDTNNCAKTLLLVNSKIVTEILKTVFDNSSVVNKKEIIQKYNADRRENILLNNAIKNIVSVLNDKTDEFMSATIENSVLNSESNDVYAAKIITDNARLVAHEIKNNISVIKLYSDILKKRLTLLHESELTSLYNSIDNIISAADNITADISELREISLPVYQRFNLFDFINQTVALSYPKLKEKNLKLNIKGDKQFEIYTDIKKLTSVVQNILYNAVDACTTGGNINIDFSSVGDKTSILISNDGEKIPENLKEKIFEREYTSKETGNGLGLYICRKIMTMLDGQIKLVSSDDNSTVFEISL